jgi:hypothetical protein
VLTAEAYALVEGDAEPLERLKDILLRTRYKTVGVGVLDTEDEVATMLFCKQIIV